ncbi:MAG: glycoside hydrolase family 97 catalytic domain-containing protein [Sedimentisphaerales bacterium]|jgi:alpha-glucosidase|nr:glycoside hydrolase family 97 catalytic domain-containing protein [Sedimentisphaerales bacterium]
MYKAIVSLSILSLNLVLTAGQVQLLAPAGKVEFVLATSPDGLRFSISFNDKPVIEPSPLIFVVDDLDLTSQAAIGAVEYYRLDETYPYRGVHSLAHNRCNGTKIDLVSKAGRSTLEVRAFDDGVAFRHIFTGPSGPLAPDEQTRFILPAGSIAWYHDLRGHYEGQYDHNEISMIKAGQWLAPPVTIQLPNGAGYAAITEAALIGYSGMALQADGKDGLALALAHRHPISYPYQLRYTQQDIDSVTRPARISGTITTPWRVVIVGIDLNTLVNSDIIPNLCPGPDPDLFPKGINTDWIRPGRAVWRYLDGGQATLEGAKEFCRLAGQLGFEYNVIEGYWSRWTDEQIRDLVEYAKAYKVGLWFWVHSRQLRDPDNRRAFFARLKGLGIKGAKIDFFDHEHKDVIDLYQALLEEAARNQILVNFHGANKPTGQPRTWPNELVREAVRGMESRSLQDRATHDVVLPFTRYLAGHADYTPVHLGDRRANTTWAHQIATAIVFTSPLLTYAAHPQALLDNPAVEIIKAIPATWDQTIVLPVSQIGQAAAFARRKGDVWFLGILNCPTARSITIDLGFLADGQYKATIAGDRPGEPAALEMDSAVVDRSKTLQIGLQAGGGYVAMFSR